MLIRKKGPRALTLNEPIKHQEAHKRPVSRRDFISQGFLTGPAVLAGPSALLALLGRSGKAHGLSPDLQAMQLDADICDIQGGAGKVPFICFDLAGGANLAGSEVLIGNQDGQEGFLSTAGYAKLGLPGDMVPNAPNAASPNNNFIDRSFGLAFHSDGAILRGMLERTAPATRANTNGATIAARSENDTANNPHNPMYGIYRAGGRGELLHLIGSRASDSGGNSVSPMSMVLAEARPTKVDRASDVTGLVDTGELGTLFTGPTATQDAIKVLEAMTRASHRKSEVAAFRAALSANTATSDELQKAYRCGFVKSAYLAETFSVQSALNPDLDAQIVGPGGIFTQAEYNGDDEFRKTAAVMKMVVNGFAAAGTVTMGGYDYHGQGRATGELRNFRAGRCIGACLEYAARMGKPLMVYVFSDGSLNANGQVDNTADGRGKFMWVSDNQSTASSFFMVYSPNGPPQLLDGAGGLPAARHQQIGYFRADASVETASHPGANAVNLLVETVILNWMALNGEQNLFQTIFPQHGLGSVTMRDGLTAFDSII
jgi:hypothetical protein